MTNDYAVRGVSELGREWFYTGKAGEKWVSPYASAAFLYTQEAAQRKALMFNRTTELHGLRFVAFPVQSHACPACGRWTLNELCKGCQPVTA